MSRLICAIMVVMFGVTVPAMAKSDVQSDAKSENKLAAELVKLTQSRSLVRQIMSPVKPMLDEVLSAEGLSDKHKKVIKEYTNKTTKMVRKEVRNILKSDELSNLYAKVYSQAELQGLVDFYKSELGQNMINKMPKIMDEVVPMVLQLMNRIKPQIQSLMTDMEHELKAVDK